MNIEDKIDPSRIFPCVRAVASTTIHGTIVKAVYDYWIKKRVRLGKALMRQYQEPPPRGNTDPHVAFRLRIEGRRSSKRIVSERKRHTCETYVKIDHRQSKKRRC